MKLALIMGNYEKQGFPPLGVLYLAGYVEKYNPDVEIKVYDIFPPLEELLSGSFDIIGLSAMSFQYPATSAYAKKLRKEYGGIILLGGVHVSLTFLLPEWADIAIIGEGEQVLSRLLTELDKTDPKLENVRGLIFRKNGKVIHTAPADLIADLDQIPFPARHMIDMEPYLLPNNVYGTTIGRGLSIMTSRGCTFHCEYCSASEFWKKLRFHSAEYVVDEMEHLVKTYQIEHLWMSDDHFGLNIRRLKKIADLMEERNLHLGMGVSGRVESYTEEMGKTLKRLGVKAIAFGLETGSDRLLKKIKHGQNLTVAEEAERVRQAAADGFEIHGMFMINIPGETRECLNATLEMIHSLPLTKCSVAVATPYMGTKWWDLAREQGIVPEVTGDSFWETYDMKKLEDDRPIFINEVGREELQEIYAGLQEYSRSLFYFDWRNRGKTSAVK